MTQFSDNLFVGAASWLPGQAVYGTQNGAPVTHLYSYQAGTVDASDADGICVAVTSTGAATLSATGALVSGGVATFDVPRNVALTATSSMAAVTFTLTGTDLYGQAMTEAVVGATGGATAQSQKAFKTVSSVVASAAVSTALNVGTGDKLGLPFRAANAGVVISFTQNGIDVGTGTVTAGLSATGTSTATTADVRGLITSTSVTFNNSNLITVTYVLDPSTKETLYGAAQA